MSFTIKHLTNLVKVAVENKASDIHLREGETPSLRIRGDIIPVQTKEFMRQELVDLCEILFNDPEKLLTLDKLYENDGSFSIPGLCRLRFNYFRFQGRIGIILRIINTTIPSISDLGLSPVIEEIAKQKRGLILLTGATGSGKSTTMAAMINHINQTQEKHIITVEDPIEYLYPRNGKSKISQREVGIDTYDFSSALRSALRQDPDVICIGEIRDTETITMALKASETGHTVFSTLHTTDAVSTIGRIIAMFPPAEQADVRKRLSENLYATIGQRMLKSKQDKQGMIVAQEIMITSPGIKECILGEVALGRIPTIIAHGRGKGGNGGQTFDQHIMELYQQQLISKDQALNAVGSQSDFLQKLIIS